MDCNPNRPEGVLAHAPWTTERVERVYRDVVEAFFTGHDDLVAKGAVKGDHVWVCRYDACDTLVIEPEGSGGGTQFEWAVRIHGDKVGTHRLQRGKAYPGFSMSSHDLRGHGGLGN